MLTRGVPCFKAWSVFVSSLKLITLATTSGGKLDEFGIGHPAISWSLAENKLQNWCMKEVMFKLQLAGILPAQIHHWRMLTCSIFPRCTSWLASGHFRIICWMASCNFLDQESRKHIFCADWLGKTLVLPQGPWPSWLDLRVFAYDSLKVTTPWN